MGVHVLDTLVRPVESIPEGQGGQLVEEIRVTAAGSAGGTAITLAKLGAEVRSAGAIGNDPLGDQLVTLLERDGVDTSLLVRRDDVHPGGPEFMGGEAAARVLSHAREHGVVTSADILADGDPGLLEWIGDALPQLDYLLPNREQVLGFTGADDVVEGCRALVERGVGCVAATCGAEGVVVVDADSDEAVPAFEVDVVDTTGCGDAFSAGFLRGLSLERDRSDAAVLGCAAAALVAGGLGSDHGDFDLEAADAFAAETAVRSPS